VATVGVVGFGSRGDLFPLLGVGKALAGAGHAVLVHERAEYRDDVERTGLQFVSLGEGSSCDQLFQRRHRAGNDLSSLISLVRSVALPGLADAVAAIVDASPRPEVLVGPHFQFAVPLAAELLGISFISIVHPSIADVYLPPPVTDGDDRRRILPLIDRLGTPRLNELRERLGLPPKALASTLGGLSDDMVWVMASPLFVGPTGHWPERLEVIGYPAYDGGDGWRMSRPLQDFLRSSELGPLVVCTLGDSWGGEFPDACRGLEAAARREGFRVLYLTGRGSVISAGDRCHVERYVPLTRCLRFAEAIVHHGGMGTLMAALRSATPSVLIPHWLDGPGNAARAVELGAARSVGSPDEVGDELGDAVASVLADDDLRSRCRDLATAVADDPDPGAVAVTRIDQLLARRPSVTTGARP